MSYINKSPLRFSLAMAMIIGLTFANFSPAIAQTQGIEVTNPNSGDRYEPGDEIQIRWSNLSVSPLARAIAINLIPDSPACLSLPNPCDMPTPAPYMITESTTDDGAFNWNIPTNLSSTYMGDVQIEVKTTDSALSGISDVFTITADTNEGFHPVGSLLLGLDGVPTQGSIVTETGDTTFRKLFPSGEVFMSHGYKWQRFVAGNSADQNLPLSGNVTFAPGAVIKSTSNPTVYLVSADKTLRPFSSWNVFTQHGYTASMIWTSNFNVNEYTMSGNITSLARHVDGTEVVRNGTVYFISDGVLHPYPSLAIYNSWHTYDNDFTRVVPSNSYDNSLPIGSFQTARIYPN